jgi:hypothetical protein
MISAPPPSPVGERESRALRDGARVAPGDLSHILEIATLHRRLVVHLTMVPKPWVKVPAVLSESARRAPR